MSTSADTDVAGPTRGAERFEGVERWSAHPRLALMTRVMAYGVPLVVAVSSGWLLGRQGFTQSWPALVRWAVMSAFATGVLFVVERARPSPASTERDCSISRWSSPIAPRRGLPSPFAPTV